MTDVAAAAGVAGATVHRYFPSRTALVEELSRVAVADASARLGSARVSEVGLEEGIARAVRALVETGDAFVVLARDRPDGGEFERGVLGPVRQLLDAAVARGEVRTDI